MDEQDWYDFLSAFGEEFCEALPEAVECVPQDSFEIFKRVMQCDPTPELLAALSDTQFEQLRKGSEDYFEFQGITVEQIQNAVARTLGRWPS